MKVNKQKENILIRGYMGKVEQVEGQQIEHNDFNLYLVKYSKHWAVYEQLTGKTIVTLTDTKKEAMDKLEETLNTYSDKLKEYIQTILGKDGYIKDYKIGSWIRSA
jgi:hypothetical protein